MRLSTGWLVLAWAILIYMRLSQQLATCSSHCCNVEVWYQGTRNTCDSLSLLAECWCRGLFNGRLLHNTSVTNSNAWCCFASGLKGWVNQLDSLYHCLTHNNVWMFDLFILFICGNWYICVINVWVGSNRLIGVSRCLSNKQVTYCDWWTPVLPSAVPQHFLAPISLDLHVCFQRLCHTDMMRYIEQRVAYV